MSDYAKKLQKWSCLLSLVYKVMLFMLANAPNAIRNRSHNAYIIARGAISSVLKEVQKYTMTKEKRLG